MATEPTPPPADAPIASPLVYAVRKKCYLCGTVWDGKAFTPQPEGAEPLPGMCAGCLAKEDEYVQQLERHRSLTESGQALPELKRPRRVTDELDDDVDDDRHSRIAP
jgi:ribosome-binding protein aMBF1 (putative translation factor)